MRRGVNIKLFKLNRSETHHGSTSMSVDRDALGKKRSGGGKRETRSGWNEGERGGRKGGVEDEIGKRMCLARFISSH